MKKILSVLILSVMMLSGCNMQEPTAEINNDIAKVPYLDVTDDELIREIPEDQKDKCTSFTISASDIKSDTQISLVPVELHCSDGKDRIGWSVSEEIAFLSNNKGKETTDGFCAITENLSMISWIASLEGESIGSIMDAITLQQVKQLGQGSSMMISNTIVIGKNTYLTEYRSEAGKTYVETYCLLNVMDADVIQMYLVTRTYEAANQSVDTDDQVVLKEFVASEANREMFQGVIKSLLGKLEGEGAAI